jgi:hypothetical protein
MKTCPNCKKGIEDAADHCDCGWHFYLAPAGERPVPWYTRGFSLAWKAALLGAVIGWIITQPEGAGTTRGLSGMPSDEEILKGFVAVEYAVIFFGAGFLWGVARK